MDVVIQVYIFNKVSNNIGISYYLCMSIPYGLTLNINCLFLCFGILHLYLTMFNVTMYNTYFNKSSFCLVGGGVGDSI